MLFALFFKFFAKGAGKMKIWGLQKLTLLDYPSKTACTIFTSGCNFRCPFCQNASLALEENHSREYSSEEILSFLKKRQGLLDGVCISGGEPTLQNDLEDFIKEVKASASGNLRDMLHPIHCGR